MKQLTHISKRLYLQFVKIILIGQNFYVLLTNEHSLTKMIVLPSFLRHKYSAIQAFLKSVSIVTDNA